VTRPVGRRAVIHLRANDDGRWGRGRLVRALVAVSACCLVALTLGSTAWPAGAQTTSVAPATPQLRLVSQTPWLGTSGTFSMTLGLAGAPLGTSISVRLYDDVSKGGRLHYLDTLRGNALGNPIHAPITVPVANLPVDQDGNVIASYDVATDHQPFIGFQLRQSGVYPLVVSLLAPGGQELDSFHTAIIRLPEAANNQSVPLAVSIVAPINAAVALSTDSSSSLDATTADHLASTISSLADHPSVPLTIAPTPETIVALDQRDQATGSDVVGQLKGALDGRQVLAAPYVSVDTAAFTAAGLDDELLHQLNDGTDSLADELGVRPDRRTWLVDPTTSPAALAKLRELGVDQVVVPETQLSPLDAKTFPATLTRSFDIDVAGQPTPALMSDATLRFHVGATDDPVLNANQTIADLAVLSFDQPVLKRGAVLTLPDFGDTPRPYLDALLGALADQPSADTGVKSIMTPMNLDSLFSFIEPAGRNGGRGSTDAAPTPEPTLQRTYTSQPPASLGSYPTQLSLARTSLAGYQSMLVDLPDRDQRLAPLERLIEVSGDRDLDPTRRQQYLDAAVAFINGQAKGISVPDQQRVTLTSSEAQVPVEVDNNLDHPVRVQVTLSSDKIDFLDQPTFATTLQPGSNRLSIPVRAKSSGLFPVTISVGSTDGILPMSSNRIPIRSTAFSGLGLVLTIAAGLFLALWWARNFRTNRRSKRLVATPTELLEADTLEHPVIPSIPVTGPPGAAPSAGHEPAAPGAPSGSGSTRVRR
jgi:hypothetical protein